MKKSLLLGLVAALLSVMSSTAAYGAAGPPGGTIYAFDRAYNTVLTPTSLPNRGPFDTLYMFPNCSSCAAVSDAAPGHPGYNGGRWKVVLAYGITTQLTNAEDVESAATSIVDTGTRFVCPLSLA